MIRVICYDISEILGIFSFFDTEELDLFLLPAFRVISFSMFESEVVCSLLFVYIYALVFFFSSFRRRFFYSQTFYLHFLFYKDAF